jgi:hypothetical protein
MNYNTLIAAIYDVAREYDTKNFLNPLWIEITGEDAESVEYRVHHAPLTGKGWYMMEMDMGLNIGIWKWDGYQLLGKLDTETMAITFYNPYAEDENHTS